MVSRMQLIVYADDDEDDFFLFKKAVNEISDQYSVLHANGSVNLFELIETIKPSFIFLDIDMPGTNGIECLKMIRSAQKFDNLPVIIYSTSPDYEEVSLSNKADFYLVKPDSFAMILSRLNEVLTYNWKDSLLPSNLKTPPTHTNDPWGAN
jgi:CheY-like chemotaxis protein